MSRAAPLITFNGIGGVSTVGWSVPACSGPQRDTRLTDSLPVSAVIGVFSTAELLDRIDRSVTLTGTHEARA